MKDYKLVVIVTCNAKQKLKHIPFYLYHSIYKYKESKNVKVILLLTSALTETTKHIRTLVNHGILEIKHTDLFETAINKIKSQYNNIPVAEFDPNIIYPTDVLYDLITFGKRRILCADVDNEENNGFALFKHLYENYKDTVDVRYLTNNKNILEKYPDNAVRWTKKKDMIKWCDTICHTYENFANVSKDEKIKVFLQHGITWANSDTYISHILRNTTYATCTVQRELDYFRSLKCGCACRLTGMPIYDFDIANSRPGKNIVIMFTYRSNKPMQWIQDFIDSREFKEAHDKYGYNIYFVKHHHPNTSHMSIYMPNHITEKPISELGDLVRHSDILITDYSSISFKAAYLNKSVYYYQPDYEEYCKDPIKSKGWFSWKDECLGVRSETKAGIFKTLMKELNGTFNHQNYRSFFEFNDNKNALRICKQVLKI